MGIQKLLQKPMETGKLETGEGSSEIVFESKPEEREWLNKCLIGLLRKDFLWEEIRDEMQSE